MQGSIYNKEKHIGLLREPVMILNHGSQFFLGAVDWHAGTENTDPKMQKAHQKCGVQALQGPGF